MWRTFVIAGPIGAADRRRAPRRFCCLQSLEPDVRSSPRPPPHRHRPLPRRGQIRLVCDQISRFIFVSPNISSGLSDQRSATDPATRRVRSAVCAACRERATPSASTTSSVSRRPAVSTSVTRSPSRSTVSVTRSRVVPGTSVTMARGASDERVEQARLADVRLADDRDLQAFANQPAAARVGEQCRSPHRARRRSPSRARPARRSDSPRRESRPTLRAARSDRTAPRRSPRSSRVSVPCS